jgi:hypothetical protein
MNAHDIAAADNVPLRLVWPLEPQNFTRWLAVNMDQLGAALRLALRALPAKAVGEARIADLFARDESDGSLVLIENQLEPADDAHLGQILAYLAGSGARTLVWITKDFTPGKLDVMGWLNAATLVDYRFFAVRVEVVRRNGFDLDCVFSVLEAPANWSRPEAPLPRVSSTFGFVAQFWAAHLQTRPEEASTSRQVGPRCRWRTTSIKGVVMGLHVEPNGAEVFLRGRFGVTRDAALKTLSPLTATISQDIGVPLDDASGAVLALKRFTLDMTKPANWPAASQWLTAQAQLYDAVLQRLS